MKSNGLAVMTIVVILTEKYKCAAAGEIFKLKTRRIK